MNFEPFSIIPYQNLGLNSCVVNSFCTETFIEAVVVSRNEHQAGGLSKEIESSFSLLERIEIVLKHLSWVDKPKSQKAQIINFIRIKKKLSLTLLAAYLVVVVDKNLKPA